MGSMDKGAKRVPQPDTGSPAWCLVAFTPAPGFMMAIATEGNCLPLKSWRWQFSCGGEPVEPSQGSGLHHAAHLVEGEVGQEREHERDVQPVLHA